MSEFKILGKIDLDVFDKRNIEQEIFDEMEEDYFSTAHGDEQMLQEERDANLQKQGFRSNNFQFKTNIQMKHRFSINQLTLAFASLLLCAVFLFSCTQPKERKIRFSEDELLTLTRRAFLEGYKAALLNQHEDTVWVKLSSEYSEPFK